METSVYPQSIKNRTHPSLSLQAGSSGLLTPVPQNTYHYSRVLLLEPCRNEIMTVCGLSSPAVHIQHDDRESTQAVHVLVVPSFLQLSTFTAEHYPIV